jgi:Family of unknown function (DUF5681)
MSFKPGQSGNPGGRKRKSDVDRKIEDLARALGADAIKTLASIMRSAKAPASARSAAAQAILDRGFGRPRQTQDVTVIDEFETLSDEELLKRILEDAAELGLYSAVTGEKTPKKTPGNKGSLAAH